METVSVEETFSGKFLNVFRNVFRYKDGTEVVREIVSKDDAVGIVVYDDDGVYLVAQPREATGRDHFLEIPAGCLDVDGESEQDCAERELAEETGLGARNWRRLTSFYTTPGCLTEQLIVFAATDIYELPEGPSPTEDERIEILKYSWEEIEDMIHSGQIACAKTLVALLWVMNEAKAETLTYSLGR